MRPWQNIPFYEGIVNYPNPKIIELWSKVTKFALFILFSNIRLHTQPPSWEKTQDRNMPGKFRQTSTQPGDRKRWACLDSCAAVISWQMTAAGRNTCGRGWAINHILWDDHQGGRDRLPPSGGWALLAGKECRACHNRHIFGFIKIQNREKTH